MSRIKRTNAKELGVLIEDTSLAEQRNKGLVGGLDHQELKRVAVESDALERGDDRVEDGTAGNVSNSIDVAVREDAVFVVVGPVASLLQESGWEAVGIGLVVGQFRVNVVVDLNRNGQKKVVHNQEYSILRSTKKTPQSSVTGTCDEEKMHVQRSRGRRGDRKQSP